jgi:hypothetical protein
MVTPYPLFICSDPEASPEACLGASRKHLVNPHIQTSLTRP